MLDRTPVAGAGTRPALVKYVGMPIHIVVGLVMAYGLIIALMPDWHYRFVGFFVLGFFAIGLSALVRRDHNALRIAALWMQSKGKSLENHKWNGASVEPFPVRRSKTARGIA